MIHGVHLKRCPVHTADRGFLMQVSKSDDPCFQAIRRTTPTEAFPGLIRASHWHRRQWDMWPLEAHAVLYDQQPDSSTHRRTHALVMGEEPAGSICHTIDAYHPRHPDEERILHDDPTIGFDWSTRPR